MTDLPNAAWSNPQRLVPVMTMGQIFRRGWIFVLLGLLLGAAVGVLALHALPKTYRATAAVLVRPVGVLTSSTSGDRLVGDVNLDTEAQLVKSLVVANNAATTLGTNQSAASLISSVTVEVPANTTILSINFTAPTPDAAAAGAQAFADAYLAHRQLSAQQDIDQQLARLATQLASLDGRLKKLTNQILTLAKSDPTRALRQTQLALVRSKYTDIQAQSTSVGAGRVAPGEIISDAQAPASAASPKPLVILGGASALGLLGGLAVAWVTRFRYYRLGSGDDVEALTGKPQLAWMAGGYFDSMTLTHHQLVHFQQALNAGGHRVVVLYPMSNRVPVVSLTVALADAFAHDGHLVAIAGAPEYLSDDAVLKLTSTSDVTTVELHEDGGRLYPSAAVDAGRLVLVLGAPLAEQKMPVPPAGCDAAVIVVERGRTTAQQAQQAIQRVDLAGVPVDGVVSMGPTSRSRRNTRR